MPTGDYDDFYGHYEPFVSAFIRRRVRADDVDDLVAEVFVIAWRRRDVVPDQALPWLYRTALNVVGTRYRAGARLAALRDKLLTVPIETVGDPADIASSRERLFAAFAGLSEDDRELLLLVAWEGLANDDIAGVLGISGSACAVRIHRARVRFEEALSLGDDTPCVASAVPAGRGDRCEPRSLQTDASAQVRCAHGPLGHGSPRAQATNAHLSADPPDTIDISTTTVASQDQCE